MHSYNQYLKEIGVLSKFMHKGKSGQDGPNFPSSYRCFIRTDYDSQNCHPIGADLQNSSERIKSDLQAELRSFPSVNEYYCVQINKKSLIPLIKYLELEKKRIFFFLRVLALAIRAALVKIIWLLFMKT